MTENENTELTDQAPTPDSPLLDPAAQPFEAVQVSKAATRLNPALLIFLIFPIMGLILAIAMGATGVTSASAYRLPPAISVTLETLVGRSAPDFALTALDGRTTRISDLRGKIVFLNFWATYCAPCRQEMPALQALVDGKILGNATVLEVNQGEDNAAINDFYNEINVNLPTVLDRDGAVNDLYRIVNLPTTFVIDANGIVRYKSIGMLTADDIVAYIKKLSS